MANKTESDARFERLLSHRDTVVLDVAGEPTPWLLGALAFRLAEAKGVKPGELIAALQAAGDNVEAGFGAFGKLVWVGNLPFNQDGAEEDLTDMLSFADMGRLLPQMMGALTDAADQDAAGKAAAAQSKRDSAKR